MCSWCGTKIGYRPRPQRWENYGAAIDALGRHDGTDPTIDYDIDDDPEPARDSRVDITWTSRVRYR